VSYQNRVIDLDSVEHDAVRAGIAYWRKLKGSRSLPSRRQIVFRELGELMRHAVLVAVVNCGEEFEFCVWGDEHVRATSFNMQGGQIRDLQRVAPALAEALPRVYARVIGTRLPFALRSVREMPRTGTIASENVLLPLGKDDAVDHIIVFSVYRQLDLPPEHTVG
jgi:hypothetical protein